MKCFFSMLVFSFFLTISTLVMAQNVDSLSEKNQLTLQIQEVTVLGNLSKATEFISPEDLWYSTHTSSFAKSITSVPGLSVQNDGGWASTPSLRGSSRTNTAIFLDGIRLETSTDIAGGFTMFNPEDLHLIEIVKTVGVTSAGSGSSGGVINFITSPLFYHSTRATSSLYSSYNSVNSEIKSGIKFNNSLGDFSILGSIFYRTAEDTKTPNATLANSAYNDFGGILKLGYMLNANSNIELNFDRFQGEDIGIPGGSAFPLTATAKYLMAQRNRMEIRYNNHDGYLLPVSSFVFGYTAIERRVEVKPNATTLLNPIGKHSVYYLKGYTVLSPTNNIVTRADAEYRYKTVHSRRERTNLTSGLITGELPIPDVNSHLISSSLSNDLTLSQIVKVSLSGRIQYEMINSDKLIAPYYEIKNGIVNFSPSTQKTIMTPRELNNLSLYFSGALLYKPFTFSDLSLSYSYGKRTPTVDELFQYIDLGSSVRLGNPDLNNEQFHQVNASVSSTFLRSLLKLNAFYTRYNDLISETKTLFETRTAFIKTNFGEASLYGYEVEFSHTILDELFLGSNVSYVRGEDIGNKTNLPSIPPLSANVFLQFSNRDLGTSIFSARAEDDQKQVAGTETKTGGYTIFNFNYQSPEIYFGSSSIQLSAGVTNIFNREYKLHLTTTRGLIKFEEARGFFMKVTFNL